MTPAEQRLRAAKNRVRRADAESDNARYEESLAIEALNRERSDTPVTDTIAFSIRPSDTATLVGMIDRAYTQRDRDSRGESLDVRLAREIDLLERLREALS